MALSMLPEETLAPNEAITIASVRSHIVEGPVDPPWQLSTTLYTRVTTTFVEVTLDNGAVGWGECMVRDAPGSTRAIVDDVFAPLLVGRDARRVQALWDEMYFLFRTRGHSRGIVLEALSGVDIAIWDALGRSFDRSICDMLMMDARPTIACYASSIMVGDMDVTRREAERLVGEGYRAIKLKVGRGPQIDAARVHLVREITGPDRELMVDINCNYGLREAVDFMRRIGDADVAWIEEPVMPDDLPAYRRLAEAFPSIPLAAGESEFTTAGFREFCAGPVLSVFQPDVARAGGVTGVLRIAHLANAYGIPISPHVGACTGICAAASIQLAAALPNFLTYEHMYMAHGLQQLFHEPRPAPVDGVIHVPTGPGLGLEIDRDRMEGLIVG